MKRTLTILSATFLAATSAQAVTDISEIDWNGDNFANYSEMMITYPGLSRVDFEEMDTNGDNRIDSTELYETEAQNILARHEEQDFEIRMFVDRDGEGFADYNELAAVYTGLSEVDFLEIDLNDDNRVDTWEFYEPAAQVILGQYEATDEGVGDRDAIDTDNNNFISYEELTAAYPGLPRESFDDMDTNDDQRLDFTEFYALEAQNIMARHM